MPSTTFYNLPAEKRERLLSAARAEFARAPYEEASVNRMIRAAGIPRGSFYMYFTDKEELFRFLMETYSGMLSDWMGAQLAQNGGDLFAAFLALFDFIQANRESVPFQELAAILHRNRQMQPGLLLEGLRPGAVLERLRPQVDLSRLDLRAETDLADLFRLLAISTLGALTAGCAGGGQADQREHLERVFSLLQRGAAAKPAPCCES
ncbi:MAG TPA: TetR/AcrR family transcriptional regulator [Candidatus Flavonifractor avistercoris]|nr:TetR/AcrR family transcriptional regulator [Candidatus Flavonifractor avistercoris]